MSRPTFTASEVSRYVFCNLAWAIENSGGELEPENVQKEVRRLEATTARTPEEEQELRFLKEVQRGFAKRDFGHVHHARVHDVALTHRLVARQVFLLVLAVMILVSLIVLFFLTR